MAGVIRSEISAWQRFDEGGPFIRALAESPHARVLLVCLRAGQALRDHRSSSQVIAAFLRGSGRFVVDQEAMDAKEGSVFLVDPDRFHRIHAAEDCVVLVTMTPHPGRARPHGHGATQPPPGR